ncbi:MAG: hypothetical protein H6659_06125 [Ardenticatenaceae bacterium]|nr:hypothetical protein [Ardenticatenaceae bacterium]
MSDRSLQLKGTAVSSTVIALGLIFFAAVFAATRNNAPKTPDPVQLPPGFQPAAGIDLAARAYDNETVAEITLDEAATLDVSFLMQNLDTPLIDLSLRGTDGYQATIMHAETYRTDRAGASDSREFALPPGTYQLVLTARQSPGVLSVAWSVR